MKKTTKLVILFLSIALIVGALAMIISANTGNEKVTYTDATGTRVTVTSFAEAMEKVAEGGTVTLESSVYIDETVEITKSMTLNLNGKKIYNVSGEAALAVSGETAVNVLVAGPGYIDTNGPVMAAKGHEESQIMLVGQEYGLHIKHTAGSIFEIESGMVQVVDARIVSTADSENVFYFDISGTGVFGLGQSELIVKSENKLADNESYVFGMSEGGAAVVYESNITTFTNFVYIADGAVGQKESMSAVSEDLESGDAEESVAAIFINMESNISLVGDNSYPRAFAKVSDTLTEGVSGVVATIGGSIRTNAILVDTVFGTGVSDAALYKDLLFGFSDTDITVFNDGSIEDGYLFGGAVTVEIINNSVISKESVPFASVFAPTFNSDGEATVYIGEGVRIDNVDMCANADGKLYYATDTGCEFVHDIFGTRLNPYVVMDTSYEDIYETDPETGEPTDKKIGKKYNDEYYAKLAAATVDGAFGYKSETVNFEKYGLTSTQTKGTISTTVYTHYYRSGATIQIVREDNGNQYFFYESPNDSNDYTLHTDTILIFDEEKGTYRFTQASKPGADWDGYFSMWNEEFKYQAEENYLNRVLVQEFDIAAVPGKGFAPISFRQIMKRLNADGKEGSTGYASTFNINNDGSTNAKGNNKLFADGTWNHVVMIVKSTPAGNTADKGLSVQVTFVVNPGTNYEIVHEEKATTVYRTTGELRVGVFSNVDIPLGSGIKIDNDSWYSVELKNPSSFSYKDYLPKTSTMVPVVNDSITVNGVAYANIGEALKAAEEQGSFVMIDKDVFDPQIISKDSADGYVILKEGVDFPFTSEKAANFIGDAIDGYDIFQFSNDVYGADILVTSQWYYGNEKNLASDSGKFASAAAIIGTYPVVPDEAVVEDIVIGTKRFVFDGWTSDKYVWYGDYRTPEEYLEAVSGLSIGIKTIAYQDIIYGEGPTYYPIYKMAGDPTYYVINPFTPSDGGMDQKKFGAVVGRMEAYDSLVLRGDVTATIGTGAYIASVDGEEVVVNIDLCGNTLTVTNNGGSLITISSNVTLNVYSSEPGGKINFFGGKGAPLFTIEDGAKNAHINIGAFENYSGSNIEIHASSVVEAGGDEASTVVVNGGIYARADVNAEALFYSKNNMGPITVDNATVVATAGDSEFFKSTLAEPRGEFTEYDCFSVKSCVIVPASTSDTVIDLAKFTRIRFADTAIAGKLGNATNKVIVDANTSFIGISGDNAIMGIAKYSEANINNGKRSDRAIVYAAAGLTDGMINEVTPAITYYNGLVFSTGTYVTANAAGKTIAFMENGTNASNVKADVKIELPRLTGKVRDDSIGKFTVQWYDLAGELMYEEEYFDGYTPAYSGVDLGEYTVNEVFKNVYNGTWNKDTENSTADLVIMNAGYDTISTVEGISANIYFAESLDINLYIPYSYYESLAEITRASIAHMCVEHEGKFYYRYMEEAYAALTEEEKAAVIAAGFTEIEGTMVITADKYGTLSQSIKGNLYPELKEIEGVQCIKLSAGVPTNKIFTAFNFDVAFALDGDIVTHTETISVVSYIEKALAEAKAAENVKDLKLLGYFVTYLDAAYDYYRIFTAVDNYTDDVAELLDGYETGMDPENDFTIPEYVANDASALAGILKISVDLDSTPKFRIVVNDPAYTGTVTINGVTYSAENGVIVKGRIHYLVDDFAISDFDKVITISVDTNGDGTQDATGTYSFGDYMKACEGSHPEVTKLLEAFYNYILYTQKYVAVEENTETVA